MEPRAHLSFRSTFSEDVAVEALGVSDPWDSDSSVTRLGREATALLLLPWLLKLGRPLKERKLLKRLGYLLLLRLLLLLLVVVEKENPPNRLRRVAPREAEGEVVAELPKEAQRVRRREAHVGVEITSTPSSSISAFSKVQSLAS
jgi:hypothetical protein